MEPSPEEIPKNDEEEDDYEGEFEESPQREELDLDNFNKDSEEIEVATPDVDIARLKDEEDGKGLELTDLKDDTPSTIPKPMQFNEYSNLGGKKDRPMSPLLAPEEKEAAFNLGQSLDSKKVTSALGYLDLKQICYCLAQALSRHIEFSRGQFFLDDLKKLK
jgi:hypothetical protein